MCRAPLGPSAQAAVSAAIEAETRERTLTEELEAARRKREGLKDEGSDKELVSFVHNLRRILDSLHGCRVG